MRASVWLWLVGKELREVVRDRRTLMLTLVMPAVVYPLLMAILTEVGAAATLAMRARPVQVAVQGRLPEDVGKALAGERGITLRPVDEAADQVSDHRMAVGLEVLPPLLNGQDVALKLHLDAAWDDSRTASERVEALISGVREARVEQRVAELDVAPGFLQPLPLTRANTSSPKRMASYMASRLLPFLLIVMSLAGATATAVDITAGERERGTLLTLMSSPVHPNEVAAAKLFTVSVVALVAGLANMVAVGLALGSLASKSEALGPVVSAPVVLGALVALLPTAVYGAALLLGLAALGKTTKEAQASTAPALFISLGLASVSVVPGVRSNAMLDALPVAGPALLMRDLIMGEATLAQGLTVLAASVVTLWLMVSFAGRVLVSEPLLASHLGASAVLKDVAGTRQPTGLAAALVASAALAAVVYAGPWLQGWDLVLGLAFTQVLLVGAAWGVLALLRLDVGALMGLTTAPSARGGAAAVLWALGAAVPVLWMTTALAQAAGLDGAAEEMGKAMEALQQALPTGFETVLVLGLLPGLMEELAFRGALTGVLLRVMRPWHAIVLQALVFALAHQSLLRFAPTFVLGVLLGVLRWRSGSVLPGMFMHAWHNSMVVLVGLWAGAASPDEDAVMLLAGPAMLAASAACLGAGAWLLARPPPERQPGAVRPDG